MNNKHFYSHTNRFVWSLNLYYYCYTFQTLWLNKVQIFVKGKILHKCINKMLYNIVEYVVVYIIVYYGPSEVGMYIFMYKNVALLHRY